MFHNCGGKLKILGKVITLIGFIATIVYAMQYYYGAFILMFFVLAAGIVTSWLLGLLVYSYGELVQNTEEMAASLKAIELQQGIKNIT